MAVVLIVMMAVVLVVMMAMVLVVIMVVVLIVMMALNLYFKCIHTSSVMSNSDRFKPKTLKFVFAACFSSKHAALTSKRKD